MNRETCTSPKVRKDGHSHEIHSQRSEPFQQGVVVSSRSDHRDGDVPHGDVHAHSSDRSRLDPRGGEERTYEATGELTLHGVTRSVTFEVTGRITGSTFEVAGQIPITFAGWNIENPSFGPVTTEDHGTLEFSLRFLHEGGVPRRVPPWCADAYGGRFPGRSHAYHRRFSDFRENLRTWSLREPTPRPGPESWWWTTRRTSGIW